MYYICSYIMCQKFRCIIYVCTLNNSIYAFMYTLPVKFQHLHRNSTRNIYCANRSHYQFAWSATCTLIFAYLHCIANPLTLSVYAHVYVWGTSIYIISLSLSRRVIFVTLPSSDFSLTYSQHRRGILCLLSVFYRSVRKQGHRDVFFPHTRASPSFWEVLVSDRDRTSSQISSFGRIIPVDFVLYVQNSFEGDARARFLLCLFLGYLFTYQTRCASFPSSDVYVNISDTHEY